MMAGFVKADKRAHIGMLIVVSVVHSSKVFPKEIFLRTCSSNVDSQKLFACESSLRKFGWVSATITKLMLILPFCTTGGYVDTRKHLTI